MKLLMIEYIARKIIMIRAQRSPEIQTEKFWICEKEKLTRSTNPICEPNSIDSRNSGHMSGEERHRLKALETPTFPWHHYRINMLERCQTKLWKPINCPPRSAVISSDLWYFTDWVLIIISPSSIFGHRHPMKCCRLLSIKPPVF